MQIKAELIFIDVKNRTATAVDENTGKFFPVSLNPKSRDDDAGINSWEDIPKEGTRVIVDVSTSEPRIVGIVPQMSHAPGPDSLKNRRKLTHVNEGDFNNFGMDTSELSPIDGYPESDSANFGSNDKLYKRKQGKSHDFSGNSMEDLQPGDKFIGTKDGNAIAVLEGGVNIFKASELCQIIGVRYNDLLRIVSRNFEHFSDFGNVMMVNNKGATSFIIEGSNSAADTLVGNYKLRVELGSTGDMIKLTVLNGAEEVAFYNMKPNGDVSVRSKSWVQYVYGAFTKVIKGVEKVFALGRDAQYQGDYKIKIEQGSETRTVSGTRDVSIQKDDTYSCGNNLSETIGGVQRRVIQGRLLGFVDAFSEVIEQGSKKEEITLQGDFSRRIVGTGNIVNTIVGSGNINNGTTAGNVTDTTLFGEHTSVNAGKDRTVLTLAGNIKMGAVPLIAPTSFTIYSGVYPMPSSSIVVHSVNGILIKEVSQATINLRAGRVAIGTGGIELLYLIDQITATLIDTEIAISTHIHATAVGPSAPPANSSAFTSYASKLTTIKSLLNTIRGSL